MNSASKITVTIMIREFDIIKFLKHFILHQLIKLTYFDFKI